MKKTIFIMGIAVLAMGMSACKSNRETKNSTPAQTSVNSDLVEKHWKLYEIFGNNISESQLAKEAYITLKAEGNKLIGSGSCNNFSGTYELGPGNKIKFSQVVSTMKMCLNMDIEDKMKQALQTADNYYVKGDTLILNRARMAPLARFEAVYLR